MAIPFLLYNFVNSEWPLYIFQQKLSLQLSPSLFWRRKPHTLWIYIYMIKRGFLGWKQGSWATDNSSGIISIISLCMSLFAPGFKWWSSRPSLVRRHRRLLCDSMEPIERRTVHLMDGTQKNSSYSQSLAWKGPSEIWGFRNILQSI